MANAQRRQEDLVRQEREWARLLAAPNELEGDRYSRLRGLEPEFQQMLRDLVFNNSSSNAGRIGSSLEDIVLQDLQRQPEDLFAPNLQLVRERAAQDAARRGLGGSGLELESMGRAGIDLAIKSALGRQEARARQIEQARGALSTIEGVGAGRRGELGGFLQDLQSLEQRRRESSQGIEERARGRTWDLEAAEIPLLRDAERRSKQSTGRLIGTAVGTVAGSFAGQPLAGAQLGGELGGGFDDSGQGQTLPRQSSGYQIPPYLPQGSGTSLRNARRSNRGNSYGGYDEFLQGAF